MFRLFTLLGLLFWSGQLSSQTVTIKGKAGDYAGKNLTFYTFLDPISRQPTKVATTKASEDGTFSFSFQTPETIEIYADLEKFRGTLVVEPGELYEITLPPYSPRSAIEAASLYFEPELYWLGIKEVKTTDLNFLVRAFLTDYNRELSLHTLDLYKKKSADTVRAIVARLEKRYPNGKKPFLNDLKKFSYGELEYAVVQPDREPIVQKYFSSEAPPLLHPAWQHLFHAIFTEYLTYKSQDIRKKGFITPAQRGDFTGFTERLRSFGIGEETAEIIAVKCFYDGFYSSRFDKKAMLKGLKGAESQSKGEDLKAILPGILKKVTGLLEGSPAPQVWFKNQKSIQTMPSTHGKFRYLVFFKSNSRSCMAEMDSLVVISKNLNQVLAVVPVSLDDDFSLATKLWSEKKYPWELSEAIDQEKIRTDYMIKNVPAFCLVSPDNKVLLSPALAPSHNFEGLFLKIFRESRGRQQGR